MNDFNFSNWGEYEILEPKNLSMGGYIVCTQGTHSSDDGYGGHYSEKYLRTFLFQNYSDMELMVKALVVSGASFTYHKLGPTSTYSIQVKEPKL